MTPETTELIRLLGNLFSIGTIADVDYSAQKVCMLMGNNITDRRT